MSTDGHLTFKNVLLFLQQQITKKYETKYRGRYAAQLLLITWWEAMVECRLILSSHDRMLGHSVPHCIDECNE